MAHLILLRHARAEPASPRLPDHDRALTAEGRLDAAAMGSLLNAGSLRPELVLCSPARRTRETWDIAGAAFDPPPAVRRDERLYDASAGDILALIGRERTDMLCIVGHNPGLEDLVTLLADESGRARWQRLGSRMSTACAVVLENAASGWADIRAGSLQISHVLAPGGNTA